MSAEPSSAQLPNKKKLKRTIAQNGTNYLKEIYKTNPNPSRTEMLEILEQLHGMVGNEECTIESVKQWFKRQKYAHAANERGLGDLQTSLSYPTLTADHIRTLTALYSAQKDAPDSVIASWALVCAGSDLSDVQRWIRDQRRLELGTPEISPVESTLGTSPVESTLGVSPIEVPPPVKGPPEPAPQRLSIRLPPLMLNAQQRPTEQRIPPPLPNYRDILSKALSSKGDAPPEQPPRTIEEWNQQFAPYDRMLDRFEERLRSARFADSPR
ncbi:uncharacterized protein SCHCODRAFT_02630797 [Schizophyllum commune H4-8]|uniref:uncharacterized protein n=1 Tax=Schizophyllum commune (strain H4-8 / FGSC 9210) TaxID=578458 RepID=UPI0021603FED|nr:uncharacterized protein SCHCODRAFT_02630797 [Schizophyllum commune H4-8]KAI5890078.1 hypothetical protein SCHCODRAFT_02630797 [Schizophyllum commune H4-8]